MRRVVETARTLKLAGMGDPGPDLERRTLDLSVPFTGILAGWAGWSWLGYTPPLWAMTAGLLRRRFGRATEDRKPLS